MTFTLDTTGEVYMDTGPHRGQRFMWRNLSPFCQGYVEALLRALDAQRWAAYRASCAASPGRHLPVPLHPAFHWLAPEALALILRDCEGIGFGRGRFYADTQRQGGHFWADRQRGGFVNFPPLTITLSDDGKVCLMEAAHVG